MMNYKKELAKIGGSLTIIIEKLETKNRGHLYLLGKKWIDNYKST